MAGSAVAPAPAESLMSGCSDAPACSDALATRQWTGIQPQQICSIRRRETPPRWRSKKPGRLQRDGSSSRLSLECAEEHRTDDRRPASLAIPFITSEQALARVVVSRLSRDERDTVANLLKRFLGGRRLQGQRGMERCGTEGARRCPGGFVCK